jgi:hypothetical protein
VFGVGLECEKENRAVEQPAEVEEKCMRGHAWFQSTETRWFETRTPSGPGNPRAEGEDVNQ